MTTPDRLLRLEQTRASRLRNHLRLVDCVLQTLIGHLEADRMAAAQKTWSYILEIYVEDRYQAFTMESWTYLSLHWGDAFCARYGFRQPHCIPQERTL